MVAVLTQTIPFAGAWRAGTISSEACVDLDEAEEAGAEADDAGAELDAGAEAGADFAGEADREEDDAVDEEDAVEAVEADFAPPLTTTMDEIFEIVEDDTPAFERSETEA